MTAGYEQINFREGLDLVRWIRESARKCRGERNNAGNGKKLENWLGNILRVMEMQDLLLDKGKGRISILERKNKIQEAHIENLSKAAKELEEKLKRKENIILIDNSLLEDNGKIITNQSDEIKSRKAQISQLEKELENHISKGKQDGIRISGLEGAGRVKDKIITDLRNRISALEDNSQKEENFMKERKETFKRLKRELDDKDREIRKLKEELEKEDDTVLGQVLTVGDEDEGCRLNPLFSDPQIRIDEISNKNEVIIAVFFYSDGCNNVIKRRRLRVGESMEFTYDHWTSRKTLYLKGIIRDGNYDAFSICEAMFKYKVKLKSIFSDMSYAEFKVSWSVENISDYWPAWLVKKQDDINNKIN